MNLASPLMLPMPAEQHTVSLDFPTKRLNCGDAVTVTGEGELQSRAPFKKPRLGVFRGNSQHISAIESERMFSSRQQAFPISLKLSQSGKFSAPSASSPLIPRLVLFLLCFPLVLTREILHKKASRVSPP